MKNLRVIFMGTPDFAVQALAALYKSEHEIIAVYTQPPRPKGRGQEVVPSPVQVFAQANGLPVFHPQSLKSASEQEKFENLHADVAVVAAYGLLLPKAILEAPVFGCINIHASLLPRWRGASPIQQAIMAGDLESGVTLMQMDEGLDTGPMISKRAIKLDAKITTISLHDALAVLGAEMIAKEIDNLASGKERSLTIQDEKLVTYAPLLKKEDGKIDWKKPAADLDRKVRALNPWPGVWTNYEGKRIKILEVSVAARGGNVAGEIITAEGLVTCGGGSAIQIKTLQPEGKKAMDFTAALNGSYIKLGGVFE